MILRIAILVVLMVISVSHGTQILGSPSAMPIEEDLKVEQIDIQADATGVFSEQTNNKIIGELAGIAWDKGNFTGVGTVTLKTALPAGVQIDTFNLSSGSAFRMPGLKLQGSTDEYIPYSLFSKLWVNMTGAQANGSATIYIIWR